MNVGGAAPKEVSDEAREIALAVRGEVLAKLGEGVADFETFEVEPMCLSQVVAGTNFFFKYNVGDHASGPFIFARVFRPLPHTNQPPTVHAVQTNKAAGDNLEYF